MLVVILSQYWHWDSTVGSSFLPSTPGVVACSVILVADDMGGFCSWVLIMKQGIAPRKMWGLVQVFVLVSRRDCLCKVRAASSELWLQSSSKGRVTRFLSCLFVHLAKNTRSLTAEPVKVRVLWKTNVFCRSRNMYLGLWVHKWCYKTLYTFLKWYKTNTIYK